MTGTPRSTLRGGEFLLGAHHPHCDRFRHHLVWVGSRPLCLGCTCMGLGLPLGVVLSLLLGLEEVSGRWAVALPILIAPTFLQPFVQRKAFKLVARTAAGAFASAYAVMGAVLVTGATPRWGLLLVAVIGFVSLARGLLWLRARYPNNPCVNCPLGVYPTCSWNMERLLEGADPLLREALKSGPVEVLEAGSIGRLNPARVQNRTKTASLNQEA